jgi:hypothetical protein
VFFLAEHDEQFKRQIVGEYPAGGIGEKAPASRHAQRPR